MNKFQDIARYLRKRGRTRALEGRFDRTRCYKNYVVIPACSELEYLPATFASLAENHELLKDTLIVTVVNNLPLKNSCRTTFQNNQQTLQWLNCEVRYNFNLAWIDASSPGHEIPRGTGVGLARKIGIDSCLELHMHNSDAAKLADAEFPFIFNLDADTTVESNYLAAGEELMQKQQSAGVLPFVHTCSADPQLQNAIDWYELYMYYYVEGLRWAGSPYAFHCIGSTIVCNALAYIRAGGMPAKRTAGEDFYFLQQVAKTDGVYNLLSTVVHPSPRISKRVPFGTGAKMAELASGHAESRTVYDPRCFQVLRTLLTSVLEHWQSSPSHFLQLLDDPDLCNFLENRDFTRAIAAFQKQFHTQDSFIAAFHRWFDALASLQLVHHMSACKWNKIDIIPAFQQLLQYQGHTNPGDTIPEFLIWCRAGVR